MKRTRLAKKAIGVALAGLLALSSVPPLAGAAGTLQSASDLTGHWAERDIAQWMEQGWIVGYEDGSFQPNRTVTRAEFMALVNRSFGFTATGSVTYQDLQANDWSYPEVQKAVKAGYIAGFEDGTVRPNSPITRQEIAMIVARLLDLSLSEPSTGAFTDSASFPAWSKGAIGAVGAAGIMEGYEDKAFRPAFDATRAEAVVILNHAVQAKKAPTKFDKAGTYGPETGSQTIQGTVVITAPGVTLRNTVIEGDLTLAEGIGEGDAVLDHVTVKGTTTVKGGGGHSVHVVDSVLLTIIVDKAGGTVRLVAEGSTTVAEVVVRTGVTLEEAGVTGTGFTAVQLSSLLPKDTVVTLVGTFEDVQVASANVRVDIPSGSAGKITVSGEATGNKIELGDEAAVLNLVLNAAVNMIGNGTIEKVVMNEEAQPSTTFDKQPNRAETESGEPITVNPSKPTPAPTPNPTPTPDPAPNPDPTPEGPSQEEIDRQVADRVISIIGSLPAAADLKLAEDAAKVTAARQAFEALSSAQQALVTNRSKLTEAITRIAELQADQDTAAAVQALIEALPAVSALTLADDAQVVAANTAFGALTAIQKALVTNQAKLTAALARIAELQAVDRDAAAIVQARIEALPDVSALTLADKTQVTAANTEFGKLTVSQKALVTNQTKLIGALARIAELDAADQSAAAAVKTLIDALPDVSALTLGHEAQVATANTAFGALTASQKQLIGEETQDKLAEAITRIAELRLTSLTISNLNFRSTNLMAAKTVSKSLTSSDFSGANAKEFTVSDGTLSIPIRLFWNIPVFNGEMTFTVGEVVGSAVISTIMDYYNAHHLNLGDMAIIAFGSGDTFTLSTTATGKNAKLIISGPDWSYFFTGTSFTGSGDEANKSFTVSDGSHTATIQLTQNFSSMDALVAFVNTKLQPAGVGATAAKVDEQHFKFIPSSDTTLIIGGEDKASFFGN